MARITKKISKRTLALRAKLWPDLKEEDLWNRSVYDGFTTIPRTMPLIMNIIDDLADGKRTSFTYLALWGRAFDEMYVSLQNADELAFHSGFTGQRAVRTWRERMKALEQLGFVRVAPGTSGDLSHAVILNPHFAIRRLYAAKTPGLTASAFNALVERGLAISADDMEVTLPEDQVEEKTT
ncbi:hypothetical protein SAMN04488077_1318 [Roseovarius tolerans]|uniref:Uncharacterized protein n=1 Tax=Roseovarius tolerans TaxID=74031 RepID=A0A1H8JGL6_9RHOB|nr:hypothetical protein [Roseovarius tolerans]SEN79812.1 hypothetical protein SAMN04488077_1318 [Roseovarius tolerans]